MPVKDYKVGVQADGRRHASVRRLLRRHALCGAGPIIIKLDGWFDPEDLVACRKCAELVRRAASDR